MKTQRRKRRATTGETIEISPHVAFSSDLLTPEEERELLAAFCECKTDLVRLLIRHFPRLRSHKPPPEPWPMAPFIRDQATDDTRKNVNVRRTHDHYVHYKHRLAS